MKLDDLAVGDAVSVDCSDMYLGLCGACAQTTLMVPGGVCSRCRAPEDVVIPDPATREP
jgi:hypothetical protein